MPIDPHQGGNLSDMAVTGTSIPNDAGAYETLPSVPNPEQADTNNRTATNLAGAADNATDMPKSSKDMGATGEVMAATGDQLPAQVESKNLHFGANNSADKGHDRSDKHTKQKESDYERYAADRRDGSNNARRWWHMNSRSMKSRTQDTPLAGNTDEISLLSIMFSSRSGNNSFSGDNSSSSSNNSSNNSTSSDNNNSSNNSYNRSSNTSSNNSRTPSISSTPSSSAFCNSSNNSANNSPFYVSSSQSSSNKPPYYISNDSRTPSTSSTPCTSSSTSAELANLESQARGIQASD
ncbi:hypothetical protein D6D08_10565 [Aureobasidium pullulans]|nr:hypothetical protein D6D08_10565 [Aureobasidium pullulans]